MKFSPPSMTFLGYVCVLIRSIVSSCLWPHVFSLLGSSVHEFSRQEHWSGLPFPPPGDLPNPGIKPPSLASPALAGHPFTSQSVSLVVQLCPTLCDPMDCSTPGLPVHHQLLELAQTPVHWVSEAIQPSHPLSSPSPPALNLSQHQGLFQWVSSLHQVPKYWSFSFSMSPSKEYSGLISFRID